MHTGTYMICIQEHGMVHKIIPRNSLFVAGDETILQLLVFPNNQMESLL